MKKRRSTERSTLGLIASGITTIRIGQKMPTYRVYSTGKALSHDAKSVRRDAIRALAGDEREFA